MLHFRTSNPIFKRRRFCFISVWTKDTFKLNETHLLNSTIVLGDGQSFSLSVNEPLEVDFTCSWDSASWSRWVRAANSSSVMKLSLRQEAADPGRGEGPPEPHEPAPETLEPPPPPETTELSPTPPELGTTDISGLLGSERDGSTWWVCADDPDVLVVVTWPGSSPRDLLSTLSLLSSVVDWLPDSSYNKTRRKYY